MAGEPPAAELWNGFGEQGCDQLAARLKATVAELRFARQCLEALADERPHTSLTVAETRLADQCEDWAVKVDELAGEIERTVEAEATEG